MSATRLCLALALPAAGCAPDPPAAAGPADPPPAAAPAGAGAWRRSPLPGSWRGFTHAQAIGSRVFFLHDRDVHVLGPSGELEHWPEVLASAVSPFSATAVDAGGGIVVVPGSGKAAFRLDPTSREVQVWSDIGLDCERGAQLAAAADGSIFFARGGRSDVFGVIRGGRYAALPDLVTVNPLGGYSAGLYCIGEQVVAFGDHHVNTFDVASSSWQPKSRLYVQLGFRPRHDNGGMACQERATGNVYMTLGRSSRSVGVLDAPRRRFYHLRPRLPEPLADADRGLFLREIAGETWLGVLSRGHGELWQIPIRELFWIGTGNDRFADEGSRVEIWNSRTNGNNGDLPRQRDSVCNVICVDQQLYVQRKNIVRRIDYQTIQHSKSGVGAHYGNLFAQCGAAFCYDGEHTAYLCNGYENRLWAVDLRPERDGKRPARPVDIQDLVVRDCAPIPAYQGTAPERDLRGRNTAMACLHGQLYALFDAVTRILYRYDPAADRWWLESVLPGELDYTDRDGVDLLPHRDHLLLLAKDRVVRYHPATGWSESRPLGFAYSADGGMAALDAAAGLVFVVCGGGRRDVGVVRLSDGRSKLLADLLPDAVSVHGRRAFVVEDDDRRFLYLLRGHDSAEHWRLPISGPDAPELD